MKRDLVKETLIECADTGGRVLLNYFGGSFDIRLKENQSSVVTSADLASEKAILQIIQSRFPDDGIVCEETGYIRGKSDITWVVDPLDGTSNFAAGIPWFGVLVAVLQNHVPIMAVMHVPLSNTTYYSEKGQGVWRDGKEVWVTKEENPAAILCAYGMDVNDDDESARRQLTALGKVIRNVRNYRCTNCLLDFCYTVDGRLGGCINFNTKIWDIAPLCLMLPEAGGRLTDVDGNEIAFRLDKEPFDRSYTVLGSNPRLHPQLLNWIGLA